MTDEELLKEIRKHNGDATADMLEWARSWLIQAPRMGDKTKSVLFNFCKYWGVEPKQ